MRIGLNGRRKSGMSGLMPSACGMFRNAAIGSTSATFSVAKSSPKCIGLEATVEPRVAWPEMRLSGQATEACERASAPPLGFSERTCVALRSELAHDDHQNSNFLFRLHQLRNNLGNFIEYLVPTLELTAIFRALHGFISNLGEFRLAVSEILKEGHVVRTVYGLMFYP